LLNKEGIGGGTFAENDNFGKNINTKRMKNESIF